MYKSIFNKREVIVFHHFTRKGYALFACLGRVVVISVLSVATLQSATAATDDISTKSEKAEEAQTTDKEATLDDVEITGSRAPLALGQAARMVTVLSREEIQAAPVQSINDLLKYAIGVDVRQRGPIGAQTDISIRGGNQEQITILLNGINICDAQTGHNAFDLPCDLSDIVRIEILEGPAGRIYGTSSLVGAINIVTTPSPDLPRGEGVGLRLEGGSFGYLSTAGRGTFANQSISASYTRSDGYSRSKQGHLNSDYEGVKTFYQGHYAEEGLQVSWHAGLTTKGYGSNTFYSAKFDEQYERTTKWFSALQGNFETGRLHVKPSIYWNRGYDRFELIRGSESTVPFNHHRTDAFGVNLNSYFDSPLGRTALGAEFRNEDIVSSNLGEPLHEPHGNYQKGLNRSNLTFHLEHNVLLRNFTLSTGFIAARNTWNEMPFTLYPGIDASYRLSDNLKIYASYNTSLRMPTFTELYYSVGGHQADKYLKPEELRAVEGGVKYLSRGVNASFSVYHHHCRNAIDWMMNTTDANPVWESVNFTKINTIGFEGSAKFNLYYLFNLKNSSYWVSYSYINQDKEEEKNIQTKSTLEYLRHKLVMSLQLQLAPRLDFSLHYRLQQRAGSYTNLAGEVQPYHTYDVVDSRISWHKDWYTLYAEVNNLFARQYVDYGNVPQPGTWFMVGVKIQKSAK